MVSINMSSSKFKTALLAYMEVNKLSASEALPRCYKEECDKLEIETAVKAMKKDVNAAIKSAQLESGILKPVPELTANAIRADYLKLIAARKSGDTTYLMGKGDKRIGAIAFKVAKMSHGDPLTMLSKNVPALIAHYSA